MKEGNLLLWGELLLLILLLLPVLLLLLVLLLLVLLRGRRLVLVLLLPCKGRVQHGAGAGSGPNLAYLAVPR